MRPKTSRRTFLRSRPAHLPAAVLVVGLGRGYSGTVEDAAGQLPYVTSDPGACGPTASLVPAEPPLQTLIELVVSPFVVFLRGSPGAGAFGRKRLSRTVHDDGRSQEVDIAAVPVPSIYSSARTKLD